MKIIFVRHGHPDYKKDCLTEIGHPQAEAAAERLKDEKIDKIFSSSCGRAVETACHIAARHNLPITQLDFMREIHWGVPGTNDFSHPWESVDRWVAIGRDMLDFDWRNDPEYKDRTILKSYDKVVLGFDEWLGKFGFVREGGYYRVVQENNQTIMIVSHGGSSSVVFSHIFNLPFPFVCKTIRPNFTAITEVSFVGEKGQFVAPRFELVNDARHIKGVDTETVFGR